MFQKFTQLTRQSAHSPHVKWWLFFYSVIESVFFPVPPDVLLIPLSLANPPKAFRFALIAALGSVTGGVVGYYIGYYLFEPVALPILNWLCQYFSGTCPEHFVPALQKLFAEHGIWVIAISAISPIIPYRFCILAAGLGQMALVPFIVVSFLAHLLRYATVSLVMAKLGPRAVKIARTSLPLTFAALGAFLLVVLILVAYF